MFILKQPVNNSLPCFSHCSTMSERNKRTEREQEEERSKEEGSGQSGPWQCTLCNYSGDKDAGIDHHLNMHYKKKDIPYTCMTCGWKTNIWGKAWFHQQSVHGKKNGRVEDLYYGTIRDVSAYQLIRSRDVLRLREETRQATYDDKPGYLDEWWKKGANQYGRKTSWNDRSNRENGYVPQAKERDHEGTYPKSDDARQSRDELIVEASCSSAGHGLVEVETSRDESRKRRHEMPVEKTGQMEEPPVEPPEKAKRDSPRSSKYTQEEPASGKKADDRKAKEKDADMEKSGSKTKEKGADKEKRASKTKEKEADREKSTFKVKEGDAKLKKKENKSPKKDPKKNPPKKPEEDPLLEEPDTLAICDEILDGAERYDHSKYKPVRAASVSSCASSVVTDCSSQSTNSFQPAVRSQISYVLATNLILQWEKLQWLRNMT